MRFSFKSGTCRTSIVNGISLLTCQELRDLSGTDAIPLLDQISKIIQAQHTGRDEHQQHIATQHHKIAQPNCF